MKVNINDLEINYEVFGNDNIEEIIILHGWGANITTILPIAKALEDRFKVYMIDLPGFGKSSEPKNEMHVSDYALMVKEFIEIFNIKDCILIGHSFGGRIITKLVGEYGYTPKKIVYIDSAGVKPKRSLSYYIKVYSYKLTKKIITIFNNEKDANEIISKLRKNVGSTDYRNASDNMKKTFINVVNEDLSHLFKNINVPTLLIWGENDKDTPVSQARVFEKNIKDSGLVILKGAGHYSYLDNYREFCIILNNFLRGEE